MAAPSSRPLRILHVTATANGAPWVVALVREQQRLGHDVGVILPSLDGTIAPALALSGIPCHVASLDILSIPGLIGRARAVLALVRMLRRLRPDVVHGHLLPSVVMARLASWIADVPIRFGANAGPLTLESDALRPIEIGTAFCDTQTIASCSYTRELLHSHRVPESKTALVYYTTEQSRFDPALADGARVRRELGVAPGAPLIGIVAYFYPPSDSVAVFGPGLVGRGVKGHEVLLRAVPGILAAFPDAKFALVGRGWGPTGPAYERELHELAQSLGISAAVLFTGERNDVPDMLAAFDVSVHPSLNDNVGGTIESLLMGRPLVVSDIRGYADTVLHERTGLTVPAGDATALADAIVRLLRDPELARRLGENGRQHMLDRFTLARSARDVEEMLARETGRSEQHYRLGRMLLRSAIMPFRILPILLELRRVMRRHRSHRGPSIAVRTKYLVRELLRGVRPRTADRIRIAQVAGAWEQCEWFVSLCRDLVQRGYDVVAIIDRKRGDLGERLQAAGIRHHAVAFTFATGSDRARLPVYALRIPLAAIRLASILRRERIDIVHSHIFASVVVARLAAALGRIRHVAGLPGPRHLEAPLTARIDRFTWWLDDATVAGCRRTQQLYTALGANPERLQCIYYGADATRFDPARADPLGARRELGVSNDVPLVTLVAQFYPPTRGAQTPPHTVGRGLKGHEDFLSAARTIAQRLPAARFVLAGQGVMSAGEKYRQRLIDACGSDELLRERVIFAGYVDDVPSLLAASSVAVQCSLTENLGGTIEALLMECPVVATRVGGMPESVRDQETGLLVPPSDPDALAGAVLRLLENPQEAAALGRAGRRLMLEGFTSSQTADAIDALYRRLTQRAAERPSASPASGARA